MLSSVCEIPSNVKGIVIDPEAYSRIDLVFTKIGKVE